MAYTQAQIKQIVVDAALQYGLDPDVALAQINRESGFRPNAVGTSGELGIAQFMPATAAQFGLSAPDRADPVLEMQAWGKYMSQLLNHFGGDYRKALAGYNAGQGAVDKGRIPSSTTAYVNAIMAAAGKKPSANVNGLPDVSGAGSDDFFGIPDFSQFTASDFGETTDAATSPSVIFIVGGIVVAYLLLERIGAV